MKQVFRISLLGALLLILSCDAHRWPPYFEQLRSMFEDAEPILREIESEMISDGLFTIGPGLNKSFRHPDLPELTSEQEGKYSKLFDQLSFYGTFGRMDGRTRVDLISQEIRSRNFLFFYWHGEIPEGIPSCDSVQREQSCGDCFVPLTPDWVLEYRWYEDTDSFSLDDCFPIPTE